MLRLFWRVRRSVGLSLGFVCCSIAGTILSPCAFAQFAGISLTHAFGYAQNPVDNFFPLAATAVPASQGSPNLLAIAGKRGAVDLLDLDTGQIAPLIRIQPDFNTLFDNVPQMYLDAYESGITGLAFHPNFAKPASQGYRKFYVNLSVDNSVVPGSPFFQGPDVDLSDGFDQTDINAMNTNTDGQGVRWLDRCFACEDNYVNATVVPDPQFVWRVDCFNPNNGAPKEAQRKDSLYSEVREYTMPENGMADPNSFKTILRFLNPRDFHRGGWIDFGPDGMMYVSTGDNKGHPNELFTYPEAPEVDLHGKILRIDVNGSSDVYDQNAPLIKNFAIPANNPHAPNGVKATATTADDPVYASGLRNPWRATVDRVTGDVWIGNVGFNAREEVELILAKSGGGQNFGWPYYEGSVETQLPSSFFDDPDGAGPLPAHRSVTVDPDGPGGNPPIKVRPPYSEFDAPVHEYPHPTSGPFVNRGAAIMDGVVYRGPDPTLQGKFIFYESGQRQVFMLDPNNPMTPPQDISQLFFWTDANGAPHNAADNKEVGLYVSFGEDAEGNLYLVSHFDHDIYRLETTNPDPDEIDPGMPGTKGDLNSDGLVNAKDIDLLAMGARPGAKPPLPVYDLHEPGQPGHGNVTFEVHPGQSNLISDADILIHQILGTEYGDLNLDRKVDAADFSTLLGKFGVGHDWASGDINGDRTVSGADFSSLLGTFGFNNATGASLGLSVPEPETVTIMFLTICIFAPQRRSKPFVHALTRSDLTY